MKSKILFSVILTAGLMFANFSVHRVYGQTAQDSPVKQEIVKYTCPMHSEIIKNEPGKCPTCGMALVAKKDKPGKEMHRMQDSTSLKHKHMHMKQDSTSMKTGKMTPDTIMMKNMPKKGDTIRKKDDHMER